MENRIVNYNKLLEKLKEKGITTYTIRQKGLIPQSTLTKFNMCSGALMEELEQKLQEYKDKHDGKDFMRDVNGLIEDADSTVKRAANLDQFVMPAMERGQNADSYIRELRDNDRILVCIC